MENVDAHIAVNIVLADEPGVHQENETGLLRGNSRVRAKSAASSRYGRLNCHPPVPFTTTMALQSTGISIHQPPADHQCSVDWTQSRVT